MTAEQFYNTLWQPNPRRNYSEREYWFAFAEAYAQAMAEDRFCEAQAKDEQTCYCQYCGATQEHCEMMALIAGIEDSVCCENTWPTYDPLTIALNGMPDVNTSRAYQDGN